MNRVLILGCPGSGKSTFARKLHKRTGLPLYHLDRIWWNADRTHITREQFDVKLEEILHTDHWIIDGDYSRTFEMRISACDTIFFLDYPENVCMEGIRERIGKDRPDMPWTEQTVDPELVSMVRSYRDTSRPVLCDLFQTYSHKRLYVLHDREEADKVLQSIVS